MYVQSLDKDFSAGTVHSHRWYILLPSRFAPAESCKDPQRLLEILRREIFRAHLQCMEKINAYNPREVR